MRSRRLKILLLGPFFYWKESPRSAMLLIAAIFALTILSQVGGVILWACLPIADVWGVRLRWRFAASGAVFVFAYLSTVIFLVPAVAKPMGRVPLPWRATPEFALAPQTIAFPLLARNYVRPQVRTMLADVARVVSNEIPGVTVRYYDAGFPFLNGFPLLPHRSHSDGRKVDIGYFYRDARTKQPRPSGSPSPVGYLAYEQPRLGEPTPYKNLRCPLRWNVDFLQPLFAGAEMDPERTRLLISAFAAHPAVRKVLLEPHLQFRLGLDQEKIRAQGCNAARHDDHFHVQI